VAFTPFVASTWKSSRARCTPLLGRETARGKSTLIKILSGVHTYDAGSIEIDGERVCVRFPPREIPRDAGVAVVYQDLSLVESLSGRAAKPDAWREPRTRLVGF